MPITTDEFDYVRHLVRARSGIVLEPGKEYLVDARLSSLVREQKLESIAVLVQRMRASVTDPLHKRVVEVMTTNETSFFRDLHPFEALRRNVLPALLANRAATRTLSIWCAASSTGQEPYTIAMTLLESVPQLADWKLTFVATDLSREMVERSRAGKYNQIEINRGLPAALMVKYFDKQGLEWQVKSKLREMIEFKELNLTSPAWIGVPSPLDIVFIRNVLIYFDPETKKDILGRIRKMLRPDGYLFLGCAETTMSLDDNYERLQVEKSGCYQLRGAAGAAAA
jgi:chemotaxis protein methyltransferase CheR